MLAAYLLVLPLLAAPDAMVAPLDTIRSQELEEVRVDERRVLQAAAPVQEMAGDVLRSPGVVSVADAVRFFSGVQVKDYGGVGGLRTVNIRSLGSQQTGVFYDGVQLGNAQNGQVDLGRFSLGNMESVALYNGRMDGLLQPARGYASAGSIYMTARAPRFDAGRSDNAAVSLRAGSFGVVNPSALWERRLGRRLSSSVGAEYLYSTGRYKYTYAKEGGYDTTAVRSNGDVKALCLEGGLFGLLDGGQWRAKVYFYGSERGYPGASVRGWQNEERQWDANFFAQSSLRKSFGKSYSLLINAKYASDRLRYCSDPGAQGAGMYVDDTYRQRESYLSAANELHIAPWMGVGVATDLQYNTLYSDQEDFASPSRLTWLASAGATLRPGRVKLQVDALYTCVADRTRRPGDAAAAQRRITPGVSANFRAGDFAFRAFYKHIFRMPTLNDLYYTVVGNRSLSPESSVQYDAGATWSSGRVDGVLRNLEIQLDAYFNRVRDKIAARPGSSQFSWTMENYGYVEIRGLDVSAIAEVQAGGVSLSARMSYTWQAAQDKTDAADPFYAGDIPYAPRHSASAMASASWRGWRMAYNLLYAGQRYTSRANTVYDRLAPWRTHDVSLTKRMALGNAALGVTAEVNNIFDSRYEVVACYPMPGRNLSIKIDLTL